MKTILLKPDRMEPPHPKRKELQITKIPVPDFNPRVEYGCKINMFDWRNVSKGRKPVKVDECEEALETEGDSRFWASGSV